MEIVVQADLVIVKLQREKQLKKCNLQSHVFAVLVPVNLKRISIVAPNNSRQKVQNIYRLEI